MKLLTAYIRIERAADVMCALYKTAMTGMTAYQVHGISGDASKLITLNGCIGT